jgi:hypothetical protein
MDGDGEIDSWRSPLKGVGRYDQGGCGGESAAGQQAVYR